MMVGQNSWKKTTKKSWLRIKVTGIKMIGELFPLAMNTERLKELTTNLQLGKKKKQIVPTYSNIDNTIFLQWLIFCDHEIKTLSTTVICRLGLVFGCIIFGLFADRYIV